jgi:hypothetical protein
LVSITCFNLSTQSKNGYDYVDYQIPQNFTDYLENIPYLNERSLCEFTFKLAEEEKVGWCDIMAVWWMNDSFESELRYFFQIGLGIVQLIIVYMEQYE